MLKSWSIKNFKPIVDSGELQLAPVTVFAGRNSSGKSSLLQSILMISQTLGSRLLDRPLLPNERLVQLGTFEDILSEIIHSRILELGVGLEMESEEIKTPSRLRGNTRLDIKSAKFLVRFNSASANGTSSSAIEAAKVVVENVLVTAQAERITAERLIPSEAPQQLTFEELMDPHQISFSLKKATNQDIQHFLRNVPQEYSQIFSLTNNNSNYLGIFNDNNTITLLTEDNREYQYLVALSHFLPSRLIRKYNLDKRQKENLMRSIRIFLDIGDLSLNKFPESIKGLIDHPISSDLREAINGLCLKMHIVSNFSGQNILELVAWLRKLEERSAILSDVQKLIVENMLSNDNEQGNLEGLEVIHREELEQTTEQIAAFFTSKIRYLGPLRADPQASQKFGPSSELDDVGAKGEYAAAVYEANQSANINWYNPYSQRVERKKLKEALDSWAQYLGVAQQIKTETVSARFFLSSLWACFPQLAACFLSSSQNFTCIPMSRLGWVTSSWAWRNARSNASLRRIVRIWSVNSGCMLCRRGGWRRAIA